MSQNTITVEGRRVYIQTRYGDPCVPALKRLGAHWEPQTKRWWLTSAKQAEVEAAIDFWAAVARPHEFHVTGDGDVACITKTYQEARSLDSIRRYIERVRQQQKAVAIRGEKPDEECYWGGEDWLVKGCSDCRAEGRMCRTCRHDIYDC